MGMLRMIEGNYEDYSSHGDVFITVMTITCGWFSIVFNSYFFMSELRMLMTSSLIMSCDL